MYKFQFDDAEKYLCVKHTPYKLKKSREIISILKVFEYG